MSGSAPGSERCCAFVLLAAGQGARFGPGKLLADLAGQPVWRWALGNALDAGFDDLHVVTNDPRIANGSEAAGATVHANPMARHGIASSIAVAANATRHAERTIIALADMPFVESGHLRLLASGQGVIFTRHPDGRSGVPAGFPRTACERLLVLERDRGAASLDWPDAAAIDPRSAESLIDVDTPDRLRQAQAIALRLRRAASR
jgi:molybdenum cofactor cytidylyltransferase